MHCARHQDQLVDIDKYTRNGIAFLDELREYANERSQLEREYATKLEKLAKTYVRKLRKTGNSLYGFGTALAPAAEGSEQYSCVRMGLSRGRADNFAQDVRQGRSVAVE